MSIKYNYEKLKARINEVFGTNEAFGKELGMNKQKINSSLNSVTEFSMSEILMAVELLSIIPEQVHSYFFDVC